MFSILRGLANGSPDRGVVDLWSIHRDIAIVTGATTYKVTSADIFRGAVYCPDKSQPIRLVI